MNNEKLFWLGLSITCPWSNKLKDLVEWFGSPQKVWEADEKALRISAKLTEDNINYFMSKRKRVNLQVEWEKLQDKKVQVVTLEDRVYPTNLKSIYDPPPVLYYQGTLKVEDNDAIAIVGARKSSYYGQRVAENLASELAHNNLTVISGLARGIDTAALKGAVSTKGRSIAVLGSGVDIIYPHENRKLASKIVENGAIISEYPLGTQPKPWYFPMRNRIISGLALGVVVVEAAEKSGSLITADQALEQGREVFAVPGSIFGEESKGCHHLIRQGATLVRNAEDIITEIKPSYLFKKEESKAMYKGQISPEEEKIYNLLTMEPKALDQIIEKSDLSTGQVVAILMYLELKGLVEQLPGKQYLKKI